MSSAKELLDGKRLKWGVSKMDSTYNKAMMCCMSCGCSICDECCGIATFSFLRPSYCLLCAVVRPHEPDR